MRASATPRGTPRSVDSERRANAENRRVQQQAPLPRIEAGVREWLTPRVDHHRDQYERKGHDAEQDERGTGRAYHNRPGLTAIPTCGC